MTIPFSARSVDLLNLVVAKGANFLVTAGIFALVSRSMSGAAFAEFGYWWSIAIMVGGGLLGGVSSATVRAAAVAKSLRHLRPVIVQTAGLIALGVVVAVACVLLIPGRAELTLTIVAVCAFGVLVQVQTAILALLRAIEANLANFLSSMVVMTLIPAILIPTLIGRASLSAIFLALCLVFGLGAVAAAAIGWRKLSPLLVEQGSSARTSDFVKAVVAFTGANFFSYGIVNIDFTLLKVMVSPADFAAVGMAKVFFERFALPALLVVSGAVSLTILRYSYGEDEPEPHLYIAQVVRSLLVALVVWAALAAGYYAFTFFLRASEPTLPFVYVASLSLGYVMYVANGVLVDVMIIKRKAILVIFCLFSFLIFDLFLQSVLIHFLGLSGWAIGWPAVNIVVFLFLARDGLMIRSQPKATSQQRRAP